MTCTAVADEIRSLTKSRFAKATEGDADLKTMVSKFTSILLHIADKHPTKTAAQVINDHWTDATTVYEQQQLDEINQQAERARRATSDVVFPEDTQFVSFEDYVNKANLRDLFSEADLQKMQELFDAEADNYWDAALDSVNDAALKVLERQ